MSYWNYLKLSYQTIKLDNKAVSKIIKDKNSLLYSFLSVFIASVITTLISILLFNTIYKSMFLLYPETLKKFVVPSFYTPFVAIIGFCVFAGLLFLVAKLFKSKGTYASLLKAQGSTSLLSVLSVIPVIGGIASVWSIVISVFVLKETQGISTGRAIAAYAILVFIMGIIIAIIAAIYISYLIKSGNFPPTNYFSTISN